MRASDHQTEERGDADGGASPASAPGPDIPRSVRRIVCCRLRHDGRSEDLPAAAVPDDPVAPARRLGRRDRVAEAVALVTCDRTEVYCSTRTPEDRDGAVEAVRDLLGDPDGLRVERGLDAVEHLARVACGLDSSVLGEDHVLGQVRRAFEAAADEGLAGGVVTRAADAAVSVGRRARTETDIDEGRASYGSVTCDLLGRERDGGPPDRLVVVGAGAMASSVVAAVEGRWDARVDVANRSRAPELPTDDGRYYDLDDLDAALDGADAVVSATGAPEPVLDDGVLQPLDATTPVVDLATPPDVAAGVRASAVPVIDLETVQERIRETTRRRRQAVPVVESLVEEAVARFRDRERESDAEDTLRALHRRAASVREAELERARRRLEHGDEDPEVVLEEFASGLVGSLLATPTDRLRQAARDGDDAVIDATHRLFDLEASIEEE